MVVELGVGQPGKASAANRAIACAHARQERRIGEVFSHDRARSSGRPCTEVVIRRERRGLCGTVACQRHDRAGQGGSPWAPPPECVACGIEFHEAFLQRKLSGQAIALATQANNGSVKEALWMCALVQRSAAVHPHLP